MIKEFALDPAVPAQSFQDCRYFLDALRIENGRLLARFPKKWKKLVYEAAEKLHEGKVELNKIEACLQGIAKCSLFSCGRPSGDPSMPWLEHAIAEHERSPFAAIIATKAQAGMPFILAADQVHISPDFQNTGQREIARASVEIIDSVAVLLRAAKVVKLIDPHFRANIPRWRRGLEKLIDLLPAEAVIEIHRQDDGERDSNKRAWFDGPVQRALKGGIVVKVFLHPKRLMHNRYILTDQGGATFGTGLDDNEDGDRGHTVDDDVTLLTEEQRNAKWEKYASTEQPFLELQLDQ